MDETMAASSLLRVAVVQFAPKLGEVNTNLAKARELCKGLIPRSIDLVCLPEMIFSGYNFPDAPAIAPYLEHPKTGPTATFCAELARRLQCYVTAGFPERLSPSSTLQAPSTSASAPSDSRPIGANTAVLYGPNGDPLHAYRKTNLFSTDIPWASAGSEFATLSLPLPLGRTTLAICNDLNVQAPAVWDSLERGPYELADHCLKERTRVLVLLNAWLLPSKDKVGGGESGEREDDDGEGNKRSPRASTTAAVGGNARANDSINTKVSATPTSGTQNDHDVDQPDNVEAGLDSDSDSDGSEPNWEVLNYWATRLRPLWAKDDGEWRPPMDQERVAGHSKDGDQARDDVLVIVCNRFGHERGKTFAGSSAILSMPPGSGKPRLLHAMGEREEGVSVWSARIRSNSVTA